MKDTTAILKEIYPHVESKMKANLSKYMKCASRFINSRSETLYSNAPCDKMYFSEEDIKDFYTSTGIDRNLVNVGISHTYYAEIANFNPRYAKDDFVVSMLCVIRYFKLKNMKKELDIAIVHLAASGKYYTSIFHGSFRYYNPQQHIMDYVVNNMMTNKYDLVTQGNLIGALRSISKTWLDSYTTRFKEFHDDDCTYLIQQLHNRIRSFMNNIAELYYTANEEKLYISYDADDVSEDSYHLADNDSFQAQRAIDNTMNYINSHGVNYRVCKLASNEYVKVDELKSILEVLMSKNENMALIKELVTLIVFNFFANNKNKRVTDIEFVSYTIKAKPNTKDPNLIKQKEVLIKILLNNSEKFNRRRNRLQTEQGYFRAILAYFSLLIQEAN